AHPEVLELTFMSAAMMFAFPRRTTAGGMLGLAMATKTCLGVFVPYLVVKRQWRMLAGCALGAGVLFAVVCWLQQVSPWDGLLSLIYQGGNLTKLEFTEYEYTPRAD